MNLALSDATILARAFEELYRHRSSSKLEIYSEVCLRRVWKVQRFSWWMTSMLHNFNESNPFDRMRQLAELDYVTSSRAAAQTLAENYVGLPIEG
jgi:p-hydroxybenzoate 3-monooxygenase